MAVHQPAVTHGIDQEQEPYSRILTESKEGNVEALRRALDAEPGKVDTPDSNGMSPLCLAVKKGSLPCVKLLVSKHADVNMKDRSTPIATTKLDESWEMVDYQFSPFLLACQLGHQSIVEFLFYNDADLCHTSPEDDLNCLSLAIMCNREETAKFLVIHTTYDILLVLMKTVLLNLSLGRHSERISTPMRQLIQYMPDVAEIVMDRCITLNENLDEVTCHFELLDDFFSPWARQNKDPNSVTEEIFDDDGNLLLDLEPRHAHIKNDQHPLALMERRANLLTHPLSIKLIEHKWRILGLAVNSVSLIVYLFFLGYLTGYVVVLNKCLYNDTYSVVDSGFFNRISLMILVILNIIKEIFQIYNQGRSYLNYQSLLEWSIYVTLTLVVAVPGIRVETLVICGALVIFLAWINLALYVRQSSTLGIYVIMFEDVLLSTVYFLAVILLFIIAFALTFHTLLQKQTDFHYFGDSFLRTIDMTTGELDFSRIFHSESYLGAENVSSYEDLIPISVGITFVIFVITMPIIAMNLLIGVAVEDIHRIRQKATFYYMKLKVDRIISAENMALGKPLGKYVIRWLPITVQSLKIKLSRRSKVTFLTWFTSVVDFEELCESVKEVCKRNQEREELRTQLKSSWSHEDLPDGGTDQTLLQKLCQMRDQMQDQILKVNGLISRVEQRTV